MKRTRWRVIARSTPPILERFLTAHEPEAVTVSDRVRRHYLDHRLKRGGRCFYLSEHEALLYQGPRGFFAPVNVRAPARRTQALLEGLPLASMRTPPPHSIIGHGHDVRALERIIPHRPVYFVDYHLLSRSAYHPLPSRHAPVGGVCLAHATHLQWKSLLPLQIAYEEEEVLRPGRHANAQISKASLVESLSHHLVLVALYHDEVIARAATNARGFHFDQIGGVYTVPHWRHRGIATWLLGELIRVIERQERACSLYVNISNAAAINLYRKLNFQFVSPYRISYYR